MSNKDLSHKGNMFGASETHEQALKRHIVYCITSMVENELGVPNHRTELKELILKHVIKNFTNAMLNECNNLYNEYESITFPDIAQIIYAKNRHIFLDYKK